MSDESPGTAGKNEQSPEAFVKLWGVGDVNGEHRPFSPEKIADHLLKDWCPWLEAASGTSFMGWPAQLLESVVITPRCLLSIKQEATGSERQWKSFLSWMLGVAGAREFLEIEGYKWIAPVSAYYTNVVQNVNTQKWNERFPQCSIETRRPSTNGGMLAPDYVALRSTANLDDPISESEFDWAVVEAKGTHRALASLVQCPTDWAKQARNIELIANKQEVDAPRHIVVATRVNQKGRRPNSRVIQIRAWNSQHSRAIKLPLDGAVDIVAAHLFGLFRNLRLIESARALAIATCIRSGKRVAPDAQIEEAAFGELDRMKARFWPINADIERHPVSVCFSDPLIRLAKGLIESRTAEVALKVLRDCDRDLDHWFGSNGDRPPNVTKIPCGVEILHTHLS